MTSVKTIYAAFLGKINDFDKSLLPQEVLEEDMRGLLNSAIVYFRLPHISLELNEEGDFQNTLTNDEIQILAVLMKREWYKRFIADSEVTIQKFGENDFEFKSQANHLKALVTGLTEAIDLEVKKMLSDYSRTPGNKVFDYKKLVGKK